MNRTDTHRPSVIDPTEYDFVSFHSHRAEDVWVAVAEQQAFRAHMVAHPGAKFSQHSHGGSCHVCGAHAYTVARFYHAPTNTYVEVGETCAEKLHDGDPLNFRSFRERANAGIQAAAGKAKAEKFLADNDVSLAYHIWLQKDYDNWGREEEIVSDVVGKLARYGAISDKQVDLLRSLIERIDSRAAIAAERAAEADAADPCPEGRIEITGEILVVKEQQGLYGYTVKILVRAESGWKVWGSLPSAINEAKRGDTVTFTATVTPSNDDPKIGFFKRPAKAQVL
jgi:hypothetical protein